MSKHKLPWKYCECGCHCYCVNIGILHLSAFICVGAKDGNVILFEGHGLSNGRNRVEFSSFAAADLAAYAMAEAALARVEAHLRREPFTPITPSAGTVCDCMGVGACPKCHGRAAIEELQEQLRLGQLAQDELRASRDSFKDEAARLRRLLP